MLLWARSGTDKKNSCSNESDETEKVFDLLHHNSLFNFLSFLVFRKIFRQVGDAVKR